uniref:Uncharacterized protein n=1 Tax=Arundo donax TaxID=35708 RepID=A0A0A9BY07_ARUDO
MQPISLFYFLIIYFVT